MGFGNAIARLLRLPGESVYSKALTIFVGFSVILGAGVVYLSQAIIIGEFAETERQEMIGTLQRFTIVLSREIRPVEIALAQILAQSSGPKPPRLPTALELEALQLDFVSVADANFDLTSIAFRDPGTAALVGASPPWITSVAGAPRVSKAGFIVIGTQLAVVAWRFLPDGNVILASRIFGDEPAAFIEGMFGARLAFESLAGARIGSTASDPLLPMLSRNEFVVRAVSPNELVGHVLVRGVGGKPIGQIRLTQPRPLYNEGTQAVQIFLTVLTLAGGALFLLVWFLLDRTILTRIHELTEKVEAEKDFSRHPLLLDFQGGDELGHLARRIENLAALLDQAQANYRAVVEDQTESICRFSATFEIVLSNKVFQSHFPSDLSRSTSLKSCLPHTTFELVSDRFFLLTKDSSVESFVHQLARNGASALWLSSTLRATFDPAGNCLGGQWVATDITSQTQTQQQLQESERRFRSLSNRLLRLQDDERRKIARDLHDSTAQSLSALEMNMSLLEPIAGDQNMQRIMAETRQIARDCCLELRNISYLLHPPLLDEVGLEFALQWFADGFKKRSSIDVTVEIPEAFPRLDNEVETALFRVVQEGMTNIYRHSHATRAWLSLTREGVDIVLELRDNGTGFGDSSAPKEGVGFAGMRERLALIGGRLEIENSSYGVSIIVRVQHLTANEKD